MAGLALGTTNAQIITQYPVGTGRPDVYGITRGPGNGIWFAEDVTSTIGRLSSDGTIEEFALPTPGSGPVAIVTGSDSNLWFTETYGDRIGRITPSGLITEFPLADGVRPISITAGPDGNLWFTELRNVIGRITPHGVITEFPLGPAEGFGPFGYAITSGPDGNLWFTEPQTDVVGRMSTAGVLTEFPAPSPMAGYGITGGPDGNIWFTESGSHLARITPAGVVTEFTTPTPGSYPEGITAGPDGNLWFTEGRAGKIGRITPAGVITEFPLPAPASRPKQITAGADGALWFTQDGGLIGRITIAGGACSSDDATLCLANGRFRVTVNWATSESGGTGQAVGLGGGSAGYFWFFSPNNVELAIKIVDGNAFNGKFWFFAGALSNVGYTITVTDTQTGTIKTYTNPQGVLASIADTAAF